MQIIIGLWSLFGSIILFLTIDIFVGKFFYTKKDIFLFYIKHSSNSTIKIAQEKGS